MSLGMTPSVFFLHAGDTAPAITATLQDQFGVVANLTGATVYFKMTNSFQGNVINRVATIVNATAGQVSYSWQTGDTNDTGVFSVQWYVIYSSGAQESYPQGFYNTVQIDPSLTSGFSQTVPTVPLFNTIWTGTVGPTPVQGNNGDYWYATTTGYFYGPKASGTWPTGYLVNPAGFALNAFAAPTGPVNMGGFSFTNLPDISLTPVSTSQTALTINTPSGSTVDILDISINSQLFWNMTSAGQLNGLAPLTILPTSTSAQPLTAGTPSGSTANVAQFKVNGTTVWQIGSTGILAGSAALTVLPTLSTANALTVGIPSGSTGNVAQFQLNGVNAWSINSAGVLAGTKALTINPTGTTAVPLIANTPSGSSANVAQFELNGTTVWYISPFGQLNGQSAYGNITPLVVNSAGSPSVDIATFGLNGTTAVAVDDTGALAIRNGGQINLLSANSSNPFVGNAATSYTVTPTNLTVGSGTLTGTYIKIGRMVSVWISFTWGSGSGGASTWSFSLPVTPATSGYNGEVAGSAVANQSGALYIGGCFISTASAFVEPLFPSAPGTASVGVNSAASHPFASGWTTGNTLSMHIMYESLT